MAPLFARVKAILISPAAEWQAIEREPADVSDLVIRYLAILALIPALARFIGRSLIGGYTPISTGLFGAIAGYLLTFAVVYAIALVIHALAPRYGARRSLPNALKLTVYAYTPVWLAGIFLLVPGLSFLTILGLYCIYLLLTGLPPLMRAPPEKALRYTAEVGACALVLAVVLGVIQIALFDAPL